MILKPKDTQFYHLLILQKWCQYFCTIISKTFYFILQRSNLQWILNEISFTFLYIYFDYLLLFIFLLFTLRKLRTHYYISGCHISTSFRHKSMITIFKGHLKCLPSMRVPQPIDLLIPLRLIISFFFYTLMNQ